ncbi:MAG TPA: DUF4845 domain-containing protein [Methylophilaceae bacterium]|nr:DUF4845 domain-containing protein [Methylophilaceae bacterium]
MHQQRGMTFIGLVFVIATIVFVAVIGMKLTPAYLEFLAVKKAITKIQKDPSFDSMSKKDIEDAFYKSATIDDISSVDSSDLQVSKSEAGDNIVTVEYQKVVPLVANVSALLDFKTSTNAASAVK